MVKKLKIYKNFNILKKHQNSILLVGNFDGLHLGHQKLFNLAKKYKKEKKVKLGVITFDPIPKMFFNKELKNYRISNLNQKINYFKKKITINQNDIIVTSGASEALFFTLGSIMDPGDEIIIPEPFYANYNGFSIANGIKIAPITSTIDDNFSLPKISEFKKLINPKNKSDTYL